MKSMKSITLRSYIILIVSATALLLSVPGIGTLPAHATDPGETAYNFLNIGTDARGEGMGGAQTGLADGLTGLSYNPAALAASRHGDVVASYVNWVTDIQSGLISSAWRVGAQGRVGVSVQYLDFGNFAGFDQQGVSTGDFGASDFAVALHGAGLIGSSLAWGAAGRLVMESIDGESSTALTGDLGLLYSLGDHRTRVGAAVRNLGAQTSNFADTEKDDVLYTLAAGLSHQLQGAPLLFAADVYKPADDDPALAFGLEFSGLESVRFRAGYNSLGSKIETGSNSDNLAGIALGAGFLLGRMTLDYAFSSLSELGDAHRFTLRSNL